MSLVRITSKTGKDRLHARSADAAPDGTYLAVTLFNREPLGVMAWAGRLLARSVEKSVDVLEPVDFTFVEKVSFCCWQDAWDYFADREYADLVERLRHEFDAPSPKEFAH